MIKRIIQITIFAALLLLASQIATTKLKASIISKTYNRTYEVQSDYIDVTESKDIRVTQSSYYIPSGSEEGFIIFFPIQNDPEKENKTKKTLASLSLKDSLGEDIVYSTEETPSGNLKLIFKINNSILFGQTYTITLKYKSYGLIVKSGNLRDTYIPGFDTSYLFDKDDVSENVLTNVMVPKSLGELNFTLPQGAVTDAGDKYIVTFKKEDLVGETGWIQIGKKQYYQFKIDQEYKATSTNALITNTYKILLPREVLLGPIHQDVVFTKFSPNLYKVETDEDGNFYGVFKIPANENGHILVEGYAKLNKKDDLDLSTSGTLSDVPQDIKDRDLNPAKYWEVNSPEIMAKAKELARTETNVYKLVEKTYKFIVDSIDYSQVKKFGVNQRQGALATLKGGAAVCMEYSDLFITLMRAQGVPARAAYGTGYSGLDFDTTSQGTINHQWAEVYLPSLKAWVAVDPTWGESGRILIGGDLNHFYSHVASLNPDSPSTTEVSFYGEGFTIPERVIDVLAMDTFPTEGKSESQLIAEYPAKPQSEENLDNIVGILRKVKGQLDNTLGSLLKKTGLSDNVIPTIRNIIYIIPVLALSLIIVISIVRRELKILDIKRQNKKYYSQPI